MCEMLFTRAENANEIRAPNERFHWPDLIQPLGLGR